MKCQSIIFVENCINILHMFTLKTNVNYYIFAVTAIKRCFANCDIPNLLVPSCHVNTKLVLFFIVYGLFGSVSLFTFCVLTKIWFLLWRNQSLVFVHCYRYLPHTNEVAGKYCFHRCLSFCWGGDR